MRTSQSKFISRIFIFSALVASLLGSPVFVTPAYAAGIAVNSTADTVADDGACTLREAITNANDDSQLYLTDGECAAGAGNDTIQFSNSLGTAVITISSTLPNISDADGLTINGGGDISVSGASAYLVFIVDPGTTFTVQNLAIKDARCPNCNGNGIYSNTATLIVSNSVFSNNIGAIYSYGGSVDITNSTFSGNTGTYGAGISFSGTGTLNITGSSFTGNSATASSGGGAIYTNAITTITNSTFSSNTVESGNGVFFNDNDGITTISNSTFTDNSGGTGVAVYNNSGGLTIVNSTFKDNTATGYAGAVSNISGDLTINNSTFSNNNATSGGGDLYQYGNEASLEINNSILANNVTGGNCQIDTGTVSGNNNLIEGDASVCGFSNGVDGNIIGSAFDPVFGTATGSPAYLPLNFGSPAINTGDNTICAADPVNNTSQNGVTRPSGGTCDIGSYEFPFISTTLRSLGANDGWILESTETSTTGGTMNSIATTFNLGDDASDKQYRAILHFNTSSLPDTAVITSAILKLKKQGGSGTDPFTILGALRVDARRPSFGTAALQLADFRSTAGRNNIATFNITPVNNWYSGTFNGPGRNYINKTGTTQFRVYFTTDDNNDNGIDIIKFYSGNAAAGARPKLVIQYYVP